MSQEFFYNPALSIKKVYVNTVNAPNIYQNVGK